MTEGIFRIRMIVGIILILVASFGTLYYSVTNEKFILSIQMFLFPLCGLGLGAFCIFLGYSERPKK